MPLPPEDDSDPVDQIVLEEAESPEVRRRVRDAVRGANSRLGLAGMLGDDSAAARAAATALGEVAREEAQSPEVRRWVRDAVRGGDSRLGLAGMLGGDSAAARAAATALKDIAHQEALSDDVRHEIRKAIRGAGAMSWAVSGALGPRTSVVDRAATQVVTEAARHAAQEPDVQDAIRAAVRQQAARSGLGSDPALLLAMQTEDDSSAIEPEADNALPQTAVAGHYSPCFAGPQSLFGTFEVVIDSFSTLLQQIDALSTSYPGTPLVWRGHENSTWGLHSNLYRRLLQHRGVADPEPGKQIGEQVFPGEDEMLVAELALVREAEDWRMTDLPALELFARLQHQGGPTRLLDVTRNPLIATWFAVENPDRDHIDGRLFAIATGSAETRPNVDDPALAELLERKHLPFWSYASSAERRAAQWGTGERRRTWIPPAYDPRIAAQNAAFLLEGVPVLDDETVALFGLNPDGRAWSAADVAASLSIAAKPSRPGDPVKQSDGAGAYRSPLFTFRLRGEAKAEVRQALSRSFGFDRALLYPDIQGLSARLQSSDWLRD